MFKSSYAFLNITTNTWKKMYINLSTLNHKGDHTDCLAIMRGNVGCHLTHWGWETHICISKLTDIGFNNGLLPDRRQAIIGTNAGILLIGPLGTNFSENLIRIQTFSFKKMPLKMSSVKWRPFCLSLNVLSCPSDSCQWSQWWLINQCDIFLFKNT